MALLIEDYALIGDSESAALVGINGSIDWLCVPRFDSPACFATLLGTSDNGHWLIAPRGAQRATRRRYVDHSLVLESEWETADGVVRVTDFMPPRTSRPIVVRRVRGVSGTVEMEMALTVRFDYGRLVPWARRIDDNLVFVAGPDALTLHSSVPTHGEGASTVARFSVSADEQADFTLAWQPSYQDLPEPAEADELLSATSAWWREWTAELTYDGDWREEVRHSLMILKALTHAPTGSIIAAPTTSLPEAIGGVRNWDYRYSWLRDASFTLWALNIGGFSEEAHAWRNWLLRAAAGNPDQLQVLYGVTGESRLPELELDWLPGYENSRPVRIGNAASKQFQLDVYGEVVDALHVGRTVGLDSDSAAWALEKHIVNYVIDHWREPDEGMWETRGPRRHFTHSKVLAWVALDRGVAAIERFGLDGPLERWKAVRAEIHADVCRNGYDAKRNTFTQYYGSDALDAGLLHIPLVHFLPVTDPRMTGTVRAIQKELMHEGFVLRYLTHEADDGLPPGEGAFLACTFWLVDNLALLGEVDEAQAIFERLLALRNDVGLMAEEWDPVAQRQLGNFPQALTHVGLVNSAFNLDLARNGRGEPRG